MNIVCIGGGPAGLYFALLMKKQDRSHRVTRGRAQPALRHLRLGRRVLRPDARQPAAPPTRRARPRILDAFNHWDDIEVNIRGATITLGRPRLLRHRPQAPAQHPAGALRGARRRARCSRPTSKSTRDYRRRRPRHRQRRPQQPRPRASTPTTFEPDVDVRPMPLRLARHDQALRRLHLRLRARPSTAGSRPTPTSSTTHLDLHRRDARGGVARRRPRHDGEGRGDRLLREAVRRGPRRPRADVERARTCAARAVDQASRASSASAGCTGSTRNGERARAGRADGRRGPHRALLDRLGHQARAGGRDRAARRSIGQHAGRPARRAASTTRTLRSVEVLRIQNAARNSTEWFENVDRYVAPAARAVRLFAADAQPAHQPREPAPARQGLRRGLRGLDRRARRRCRRAHARDAGAADVHAVHAARRDARRTASSSRRWRSTRRRRRAGDYHLVHLGARAMGGAGLVFAEMTCPSPEARITPGCPGLWNDGAARRLEAHRRLRPRATATRRSRMQLGHAGRQGLDPRWPGTASTSRCDARQLAADLGLAAAVPRRRQRLVAGDDARRHGPRARRLRALRRAAPPRPASTGSSCTARTATCCRRFISPLTNQRTDEYGGSLDNRLRYPLEVFRAMRAVWPEAAADVGAHLGARLGRGRHHARRRGRDRARLQGGRRRPDRLLVGPGQQAGAAGLRPHVPDAVRRPHPQRGRHRRPSPSARSPRPTTSTASSPPAAPTCAPSRGRTWPIRRGRCSRRRRSATPTSPGRSSTGPASCSSSATSSASARRRRKAAGWARSRRPTRRSASERRSRASMTTRTKP